MITTERKLGKAPACTLLRTWGLRCPWVHNTVGAEHWPSPHAPLSGQNILSLPPLPCHRYWAHVCCVSAARWRPAPTTAACASATAQSCFLSFSGRRERWGEGNRWGSIHVFTLGLQQARLVWLKKFRSVWNSFCQSINWPMFSAPAKSTDISIHFPGTAERRALLFNMLHVSMSSAQNDPTTYSHILRDIDRDLTASQSPVFTLTWLFKWPFCLNLYQV